MSKENRMIVKILLIAAGVLIIGYILAVSIRMNAVKQPEGSYIRLQDALILAEALEEGIDIGEENGSRHMEWTKMLEADRESILTYGQFADWLGGIIPYLEAEQDRMTAGGSQSEGETGNKAVNENGNTENESEDVAEHRDANGNEAANGEIIADLQKEYRKKYKDEFQFLQKDWYRVYDALLGALGRQEEFQEVNVTVLGCGGDVTDGDGNVMEEGTLLAEEGVYFYRSDVFERSKYQGVLALKKGEMLLTVLDRASRGMDLNNIWIVEAEEGEGLLVFYKGYEIFFPYEKAEPEQREQIGDLAFADGVLQSARIKGEKINGKLLSIGEEAIEIEGKGKYPYEQEMAVYRLYGKLGEGGQKDLRIGYDFTDFVLEDGKICAGLITRDEAMENIRVVIKNTGYAGPYHEKAEFTADTDFVLRYGSYDNLESREYHAGDVVSVDKNSEFFSGERIYIEPAALTGRIKLFSVERAQGNPEYRGKMEITRTEEGLVLVNELLLEEYLYSVVPSEMPSSYPLEALKAQAVCARTYAYRHMLHSGIAGFGAHVDDSAGYQVYNNIAENAQTTKAVKETSGSLLYYGEELCGSYYYSTSCGFGTDAGVWKSGGSEDTSYLQAKRIGEKEGDYTGVEMSEEENFADFISGVQESDYESGEAWYRWTYESKEADSGRLLSAMQKRYEANEKLVLTKTDGGSFESKPVKRLGKVKEIAIVKRGSGGVADELLIEGTENTFKVVSEHNIRYVLNNGASKVIRQDGSEVSSPSLLPSGYFTISTSKEDDIVVGYSLSGGGYGHGVGMSQNGAKEMAKKGFASNDILTFFYQSCDVRNIY